MQETWVQPWDRKISWRREWQSTSVSLPRELGGQKSLAGYSPWGGKRFSSCSKRGPLLNCDVWPSHCSGFSYFGARALGHMDFSSCGIFSICGSRALEHRFKCCGTRAQLLCSTWDPPGSGIKLHLLHWQGDSFPLSHQGSPLWLLFRSALISTIFLNSKSISRARDTKQCCFYIFFSMQGNTYIPQHILTFELLPCPQAKPVSLFFPFRGQRIVGTAILFQGLGCFLSC